MSISRRRFLRTGTVAALAAAIPLKSALVAAGQGIRKELDGNPGDRFPTDITTDPLWYSTKSAFSSYLNSIFLLQAGVLGTSEVTLSEVRDAMPRGVAGLAGQEGFSLIFRNGNGPALTQDTYGVEHAALGSFALFLVPGGADENGRQSYVAEVNRLANSPALIMAPRRPAKTSKTLSPEQKVSTPTNATPAGPATPPKSIQLPRKRRSGEEGFDIISFEQ